MNLLGKFAVTELKIAEESRWLFVFLWKQICQNVFKLSIYYFSLATLTSAERRCFNSCLYNERLRLFMIFQNNLSPEMISSKNLVQYHIQNNSFSSNVVMNNLHESTLSRQQASSSFQKNDFVAFYQVLSEQKGEGSWVCTFFLFNLVLLLFTLMKAITMSYYLRNIYFLVSVPL